MKKISMKLMKKVMSIKLNQGKLKLKKSLSPNLKRTKTTTMMKMCLNTWILNQDPWIFSCLRTKPILTKRTGFRRRLKSRFPKKRLTQKSQSQYQ